MGRNISLLICLTILQNLLPMSGGELVSAIVGSAISAGASLAGTTASVLSSNGPNRNIVIEISNHMDTSLYGGNYFLQWGWNRNPPPSVIKKNTREAIQFEKVGDTATGTAGIVSYTLDDDNDPASFVIIFSVPFNYIHASNWFGLAFIGRGKEMNKDLYDELYNDSAWSSPKIWKRFGYAYEGKTIAVFHNDYIISASMSNFGRSVLKVDVQKRAGAYENNHHKFRG